MEQVPGQPGLHRETASKNKNKNQPTDQKNQTTSSGACQGKKGPAPACFSLEVKTALGTGLAALPLQAAKLGKTAP